MDIYVDSNVFISYWYREYGKNIENFLEYFSGEILERTVSCEFNIIISDFTIKEIKRIMRFSDEEITSCFDIYHKLNKIKIINSTKETWASARTLSRKTGIHLSDALHAVIAKSTNSVLITWNLKDFEKVNQIIGVKSPKEL